MQRAILFNNSQIIPNYNPEIRFTKAEYIFITLGGLIWGIGIFRALCGY